MLMASCSSPGPWPVSVTASRAQAVSVPLQTGLGWGLELSVGHALVSHVLGPGGLLVPSACCQPHQLLEAPSGLGSRIGDCLKGTPT